MTRRDVLVAMMLGPSGNAAAVMIAYTASQGPGRARSGQQFRQRERVCRLDQMGVEPGLAGLSPVFFLAPSRQSHKVQRCNPDIADAHPDIAGLSVLGGARPLARRGPAAGGECAGSSWSALPPGLVGRPSLLSRTETHLSRRATSVVASRLLSDSVGAVAKRMTFGTRVHARVHTRCEEAGKQALTRLAGCSLLFASK